MNQHQRSLLFPCFAMLLTTSGWIHSAEKSAHATKATRDTHWSYAGSDGPERWCKLDKSYATCCDGKAQSPIDIPKATNLSDKTVKVNYGATALRIFHHQHVSDLIDNGHTIQVAVEEGSTLTTSKDTYQLKQFHFHTPSEHTFEGAHYPMEAHFVHQSASGSFAVVGVVFVEGPANPNLAKLIAHFPKAKGESTHVPAERLELEPHLPVEKSAYTYQGSFTTPPCPENVEWIIFRSPVTASVDQLKAFAARLGNNARPVQPLHGRAIVNETVAAGSQR